MIRDATREDLEAIVELGEEFFSESPFYCELGYSPEKIAGLALRLIESPDGFVRVVDRDGRLRGGMMGVAQEHWASDAVIASELVLFVQPGARGSVLAGQLVGEFLAWGRARGCVRCVAGSSSGVNPELCAKLYERLGFKRNSIGLDYSYV